jgi:hypothetical protein
VLRTDSSESLDASQLWQLVQIKLDGWRHTEESHSVCALIDHQYHDRSILATACREDLLEIMSRPAGGIIVHAGSIGSMLVARVSKMPCGVRPD